MRSVMCRRCFTEPGWNAHEPSEIGIDDFQSNRSFDETYRTSFLRGLGGCLDPYDDDVHRAAREAIDRLKPVDEIAVMTYHITTTLVQRFTGNRIMIENALNRIPPHNGVTPHCLNNVFADAAQLHDQGKQSSRASRGL